jgi:hypothetical protein
MIDGGLEMGSLAAVAGRKLTPFHGADGATPLYLQGLRASTSSWRRQNSTPARRTRPQKEEDTIARVPPPPEIHDHRLFSIPVESSEQRRGSRN